MKISNKLPQFISEKAAFFVLGKRTIDTYIASNSQIEKQEHIEVETPKYSDKEGFFESKGRGQYFGSGSTMEPKDDEITNRFIKTFQKHLMSIISKQHPDKYYLYSPKFIHTHVEASFPATEKKKVVYSFFGNYGKNHPFDLIKKISDKDNSIYGKSEPVKESARKILNR